MKYTKNAMLNSLPQIRKRIIVVLVIMSIGGVVANGTENVYGSASGAMFTTNKKDIRVKVISASSKQLKLKIVNKGKTDFYFSELFVLKKWKDGKWKKVRFKDDVVFRKTMVVEGGESITLKLKWKKYYGKKLSKGKYKIKFIRSKTFKVK